METVQRSIVRSSFDRSLIDKMYLYTDLDRMKYLKVNGYGPVNKMERVKQASTFKIYHHPNRV